MIKIDIPGRGILEICYLALDLNGTLSLDGQLIAGVAERLKLLQNKVEVLLITADTYGSGQKLAGTLGVKLHKLSAGNEQRQKLDIVQQLGAGTTAAIGNGANDVLMLKAVGLSICVIGPECASAEALAACDIAAPDINAALDLLINPTRLIATLRK